MISIENLSLQFSGQRIFEDISLMVNPGDRIGLVGKNGAGKTTMLRLLTGEQLPDEGNVVKASDVSLGYLPQHLTLSNTRTVIEETLSAFEELKKLEKKVEKLNHDIANRTDYDSEDYMETVQRISDYNERLHLLQAGKSEAFAEQALMGLGFERSDFTRETREFSGGWRMRIELAKLLLRSPDVFLLDEPTNHLDLDSIQWLENFLKNYKGALILISHDRAFLDNVTNRTVEITLGKLQDYKTNYSTYVVRRADRREQQVAAYKNQQKQIEETKDFIERFRYKATKANQVQSRVKQLEKMDVIEIDEEEIAAMNIKFPPAPRSGTIVYKAEELSKSFDETLVLNEIKIEIERGEKVAFIGKNGEGKTTLSRILIGELDADGTSELGHNVKLGYFAQNQDLLLDGNKSVFDTIDHVAVGDIRTKMRDILGAFLFSGEEVDKKVKVLSGGEKARLSMAKLLLEPYNLLVLDEPTNHLDMRSKDILKNALRSYDGTLVVVSHDREFLDGLVDKIYEFRNHKIKEFRGGIYDFLKKRNLESLNELNTKNKQAQEAAVNEKKVDNKVSYEMRKEIDKKIRKVRSETEKYEQDIEKLEKEISEKETVMALGEQADDAFYKDYYKLKKRLEEIMYEWEIKLDELGELEAEREKI